MRQKVVSLGLFLLASFSSAASDKNGFIFWQLPPQINTIGKEGQEHLSIIPAPVAIQLREGVFKFDSTVVIVPSGNGEVQKLAGYLSDKVFTPSGIRLTVAKPARAGGKSIKLVLNKVFSKIIGDEGYQLEITPAAVNISANKPAGLFYGIQSIIQMLPPAIESKVRTGGEIWELRAASVTDYPRFGWRGLMLDVSRHFFNKEEVESYIDQMAKYKLNSFHWHLTDNQGWRIEIKKLPGLTATGAFRVPRTGTFWTFEPPHPDEKATDGGFYTQDDIREIVQYARERYVTIVPEIDVPGHSLAFIASFPQASCTQLPYHVNPGSPHADEDLVLCAGNEDNFKKLEIILSEVSSLFPGKYIHIGGDEADKRFWKGCVKCQARIAKEKLKDEAGLQSYFIKRLEKILHSNGKKLIGWDEILEGGLAPDASVMSWRGSEGGIAASKMGHHVVMSPGQYCYFDHLQGDINIEPTYAGGGVLRLSDVYRYDPVPPEGGPGYILGAQANVWTEHIPTIRQVEYMTWPRALALSEVVWTPPDSRNIDSFLLRVESQFPRFSNAEVNYAPSIYDPIIVPQKDGKKLLISFKTEYRGLDIYYTFDHTFPDKFSDKYQGPIEIPKGASEIWAITYKGKMPAGRLLKVAIDDLEKRLQELI